MPMGAKIISKKLLSSALRFTSRKMLFIYLVKFIPPRSKKFQFFMCPDLSHEFQQYFYIIHFLSHPPISSYSRLAVPCVMKKKKML